MRTVTWTAWSSGCKRGPLYFSTRDLVLKWAKFILIVYLPLTCAIVASLLLCRWLTLDFDSFWLLCIQLGGIVVLIIDPRRSSPLQQTELNQVVHLIQFFCHWALEKYSKIHRVGEYNPWTFNLESPKRLRRGYTVLPPYLEKRKCVSTSHMWSGASWMHRDRALWWQATATAIPHSSQ